MAETAYPRRSGLRKINMDHPAGLAAQGPFEARYIAFLETITKLRPDLHRYCTRMTGSVMDGEDVVQESLFDAYRKLETFDDTRPLKPWLFQIAHNRCIDFLRRRQVRQQAEAAALEPDIVDAAQPVSPGLDRAVEHLVTALPPKERACVLLKDVFDYSLEEIAEMVDSTVGGVKAALNRGRAKLAPQASVAQPSPHPRAANPELSRILHLYVERFNRQDWDGIRELIGADARLQVADRFAGAFRTASYFTNYHRWPKPWRLAAGSLDGEPAVIIHFWDGSRWTPTSFIHFEIADNRIVRILDYIHCPWILRSATFVIPGEVS
jgi:RNA polymerase sigma-70 factor (ECF subfamily)